MLVPHRNGSVGLQLTWIEVSIVASIRCFVVLLEIQVILVDERIICLIRQLSTGRVKEMDTDRCSMKVLIEVLDKRTAVSIQDGIWVFAAVRRVDVVGLVYYDGVYCALERWRLPEGLVDPFEK
jgi:hypothetical protein